MENGSNMCNTSYPQGLRGTLATRVELNFSYRTLGNAVEQTPRLINRVSGEMMSRAASNPAGTQFTFPGAGPYDILVQMALWQEGLVPNVHGPTSYWASGKVAIYGGQWLFTFTTHAYSPNDPRFNERMLEEAGDIIYDFVSRGWRCSADAQAS